MALLDELNEALADMDLPDHRKKVDNHGSNLSWLRKHASQRNEVPERIQKILDLDINQIIKGVPL